MIKTIFICDLCEGENQPVIGVFHSYAPPGFLVKTSHPNYAKKHICSDCLTAIDLICNPSKKETL